MSQNAPMELFFNKWSINNSLDKNQALLLLKKSIICAQKIYKKIHYKSENSGIYYESPAINIILSDNYTLKDAIKELGEESPDVANWFLSLSTHAPYYSHIGKEFSLIKKYKGCVVNGVAGYDANIFILAALRNFYLLSLHTDPWDKNKILCHGINSLFNTDEEIFLCNIHTDDHEILYDAEPARRFNVCGYNLYIYYNDHQPPHIHAKKDYENVFFSIEVSSKKTGNLENSSAESSIKKFIKENIAMLLDSWEQLHPELHNEEDN